MPTAPFTAVTMRGFDTSRSNCNLAETKITQASLARTGVRLLARVPLQGDARGTEGTTLLAPGINGPDGAVHDVMIHGNMANYVSCHDAHDGTLIWETRLGHPIQGSAAIDAHEINDHWGILGTGVLDLEQLAYGCVVWSSPDGTPEKAKFAFHWLSLEDGTHLAAPVDLSGASYTAAPGIPTRTFGSAERKQRAALLLTRTAGRTTVFVPAGSVMESLDSNRGWVIAIDVTRNAPTITAAWASTAKYSGGGIWMGGQGPAAIGNQLYLMTGNGGFAPPYDLGESHIELTYTPPPPNSTAGKLGASDWFSRFSDAARNNDDPTAPEPIPDAPGKPAASNMNAFTDMDEGSGGLGVIPELGVSIGCGKDGIVTVLRLSNMGKTTNADFARDRIAANDAKALYIGWFTYFPGWGVNPTPINRADLNHLFGDGKTHHQHSTPVTFKSSVHGWMVFCWGENASLRAWSIDTSGKLTFLASSDEVASPECGPPGGMPGAMIALSANGMVPGTAILWASVPYGDANTEITMGRLLGYDPENFQARPDGSLRIMPLWDSQRWGIRYVFNKFMPPTPANAAVYLPDYDGNVLMFAP